MWGIMAKAIGIGGVVFRAQDTAALSAWYLQHLGVGGIGHEPWQQAAGPTVFSPFKSTTDYFPSDRQWMMNFRVDDLDALITQLQSADIAVETRAEWDGEWGKFARIHDPEGNPIELWQEPPAAT